MEVFISVMALIATGSIALAAWVQTHNAVRPYLYTTFETLPLRGQSTAIVQLHNGGSGPAIITDYFVNYDGKEYRDGQIHKLFEKQFDGFTANVLRPRGAIQAGDFSAVVEIPVKRNGTPSDIWARLTTDFELVVKYKSFLGHDLSLFGHDLSFLGPEQIYKSTDHVWPDRMPAIELQQEADAA